MTVELTRVPPGPAAKYEKTKDLLEWMNEQFNRFGDIYRAHVFGTEVFVINEPQYVDHVLRKNWHNYTKGQAIKRVRVLLGNGLMVSEAALWKSQRQMIQPAFHHEMTCALIDVIGAANLVLLGKWRRAARNRESVNITRDISDMILKVVLTSIFGDDYGQVAPHFEVLFDESAHPRASLPEKNGLLHDLSCAKYRLIGPPMAGRQNEAELVLRKDLDLQIRTVCRRFNQADRYLMGHQGIQDLRRTAADNMNLQLRPLPHKCGE